MTNPYVGDGVLYLSTSQLIRKGNDNFAVVSVDLFYDIIRNRTNDFVLGETGFTIYVTWGGIIANDVPIWETTAGFHRIFDEDYTGINEDTWNKKIYNENISERTTFTYYTFNKTEYTYIRNFIFADEGEDRPKNKLGVFMLFQRTDNRDNVISDVENQFQDSYNLTIAIDTSFALACFIAQVIIICIYSVQFVKPLNKIEQVSNKIMDNACQKNLLRDINLEQELISGQHEIGQIVEEFQKACETMSTNCEQRSKGMKDEFVYDRMKKLKYPLNIYRGKRMEWANQLRKIKTVPYVAEGDF